jgi:Cys-rich protein (TIGR01571 family)
MATPSVPPRQWRSDLCGCCSDCGICCWGFWCPCWLYGDTAAKLDRAAGDPDASCVVPCLLFYLTSICCLQGLVGCGTRGQLRRQFNLQGEDCPACCAYTWCDKCAACQDANEYRYQEANIVQQAYAGQQAPVVMTAPVQQAATTQAAPQAQQVEMSSADTKADTTKAADTL